MTLWGIYNRELGVILPIPYQYHTRQKAQNARVELISCGKDRETRDDIARKLRVIPLKQRKA